MIYTSPQIGLHAENGLSQHEGCTTVFNKTELTLDDGHIGQTCSVIVKFLRRKQRLKKSFKIFIFSVACEMMYQ